MRHDVIIIGGSYAGMAAALQLVRAHKSVLVIDAGERRNRFASHSHGFLGQDGVDPGVIAAQARRQLETYPTLSWFEGRAVAIAGQVDGFTVTAVHGDSQASEWHSNESHTGRRILLAIGVADRLPPITGLTERWGKSVFHCPYCHGYELNRGRIGVIATGPMSIQQSELLTDWGEVTLLINAAISLDDIARQALAAKGVMIEEAVIDRLCNAADVILFDGQSLAFAGLFVATRCEPVGALAANSGCAMEETPIGLQIRVDETKQTSIPGIFACGDVARAPHSVSFTVADGAMAGVQLHRSLLWPASCVSMEKSK